MDRVSKEKELKIQEGLADFAAALLREACRASRAEYGVEVDVVVLLNCEGKHALGSNTNTMHARILMDEVANLRAHDPEVRRLLDRLDVLSREFEAEKAVEKAEIAKAERENA